jgi:hypothetical protein
VRQGAGVPVTREYYLVLWNKQDGGGRMFFFEKKNQKTFAPGGPGF